MYNSLLVPWSPTPTSAESLYRSLGLTRTRGTIFLLPPPTSTLRTAFTAKPRPQSRMSAGAVALCKHFERNPAPAVHPRLSSASTTATTINGANEGNATKEECAEGTEGGRRAEYKLLKRKEGEKHPYWEEPRGSNAEKDAIAVGVLERVLREARWRNVLLLREGVAVYEVRVGRGWGMRWGLELIREEGAEGSEKEEGDGEEVKGAEVGAGEAVGGEIVDGGDVENGGMVEGDVPGWRVGKITFRGFLEPIAGLDHELDVDDDEDDTVTMGEATEAGQVGSGSTQSETAPT